MRRFPAVASALILVALASAQKPLSAKQVYERCRGSVVKIRVTFRSQGKALARTGSGFVYRSGDLVATAYHLIDKARSIEVTDVSGRKHSVTQVAIDPANDVALLRLSRPSGRTPLRPKLFASVSVGDPVFAIGDSLGVLTASLSQGIVSGKRKFYGHAVVQTTAAISKGNSGGPLLDDRGNAIGVVSFYLTDGQSLNMAVAINEVERTREDRNAWFPVALYLRDAETAAPPKKAVAVSPSKGSAGPLKIDFKNYIHPGSPFRPTLIYESGKDKLKMSQVAVSPTGTFAAGIAGNKVHLVNLLTKKARVETLGADTTNVTFLDDARILVSCTDGTAEIRACSNFALLSRHVLPNTPDVVHPISNQDSFYYLASKPVFENGAYDPMMRHEHGLWQYTARLGGSTSLRAGVGPYGQFDVSGDGSRIVAVAQEYREVTYYSRLLVLGPAGEIIRQLGPEVVDDTLDSEAEKVNLWHPAFSPDGRSVAVCLERVSKNGTKRSQLDVYNLDTGLRKRSLDVGGVEVRGVCFLPGGEHLLIATWPRDYSEAPGLECLNLNSGEREFVIRETSPYGVACAKRVLIVVVHDSSSFAVYRLS